MTENAVVRARIDEGTKTEAASVLATMGCRYPMPSVCC